MFILTRERLPSKIRQYCILAALATLKVKSWNLELESGLPGPVIVLRARCCRCAAPAETEEELGARTRLKISDPSSVPES
jgi:hypothetical protein